jgi:hypothetical protein
MVAERALGRHPMALPDGSMPDERTLLASVAERNVPLEGIEDGRIRLLCQGLLTRDTNGRWGASQVAEWRRGGSPPTGYDRGGSSTRPGASAGPDRTVFFHGRDYDSPDSLAEGFAAYPRDAGTALFEQKDRVVVDDLRLMLGQAGLVDAVSVFDSYRSGPWEPVFLRLLCEMNPYLAPELAGQDMTPDGVAAVARDVIGSGEATPAQMEALTWVLDHDLWRLWRRLPGMSNAAVVAARSDSSIVGFLARGWTGISAGQARKLNEAVLPLGQAWEVLMAVEPESALDDLTRVVHVHRPRLSEVEWWSRLAEDARPSSQALAVVLVGVALSAYAELRASRLEQVKGLAAKLAAKREEAQDWERRRAQRQRDREDYGVRASELRSEFDEVQRHMRRGKREAGYSKLLVRVRNLRAEAVASGLTFPAQPSPIEPRYLSMDTAAKAKYVLALISAYPLP